MTGTIAMNKNKQSVLEKIGWNKVNTDVCSSLGIQSLSFLIEPLFAGGHPILGGVVTLAMTSYLILSAYNQRKLEELVEHLKDKLELYSEDIVQTEVFRNGFMVWYQSYLLQRSEEKRKYARQILDTFVTEGVEEKFEIERLMGCLEKVSSNGLWFLAVVKNEIMGVSPKLTSLDYVTQIKPHTDEQGISFYAKKTKETYKEIKGKEFGKVLNQYRGDYRSKDLEDEDSNRILDQITEALAEMISLGVIGLREATVGGNDYYLTEFGENFINYIFDFKE